MRAGRVELHDEVFCAEGIKGEGERLQPVQAVAGDERERAEERLLGLSFGRLAARVHACVRGAVEGARRLGACRLGLGPEGG